MSWERIKNRDFEIKDRETFLKFIRSTQDLVNMDVDKAKVMKDQLERFSLGPTKRPDLKTEAGVIAWILKNNMDVKTIRKSLKDIQKSSELV
jgi:inhibitor of KinA sporulation pathway (predicted exonuclease)